MLNRARTAALLSLSMAFAACGEEPPPDTTNKAPRIVLFSAEPMVVEAGQSATLRYQVVGATVVRIDVEGGANVLPETGTLQGSVVTPSLTADTTFVITAENGAESATGTVRITVGGQQTQDPAVVAFAASPSTIAPGGSATLTWQTSNATEADIEADGARVHQIPAEGVAQGSFSVSPGATTAYTLVIRNAVGASTSASVVVTVEASPGGPEVQSFTANPAILEAGQSATLAWAVSGATAVRISDAGGAVAYEGANLSGTTSVTPQATTTYTLVATDADNRTATRTVMVTVNQPAGARVVAFSAMPATIAAGQSAELVWEVERAPGGIEITAGGAQVTASAQASGRFAVTPAATTQYVLVARSPAGDATAMTTVTVTAVPGPAVGSFTATPNPVAFGASTTLAWSTTEATAIRILSGGQELHTSAAATGSHQVAINAAVTTFTLEASGASGSPATAQVTVYGHRAPVIQSFTANPSSLAAAGPVTVSWSVQDVSGLTLTANGAPVPGFTGVTSATTAVSRSGSLQVQVASTTTFELVASSAAGSVNAQAQVSVLTVIAESEPNNSIPQANPLPAAGGIVNGTLNPANDIDIFRVVVPEGGWIRAETSDGMGGCGTDTVLLVADQDGVVLAFDDDSGLSPCSLIDPRVDVGAGDLPAGTYYVAVLHALQLGIGPYQLAVSVGGPSCGNGIPETRAGEQCDLGDTIPGDGCSATCQYEIHPTVINAPGQTLALTFGSADAFALVRVEVPNPGMAITATAADAGGTTCNSVDTGLVLLDANFQARVGRSGGGPTGTAGTCGAIRYPADVAATNLPAGTYYLAVVNEGTAGGSFQLQVSVRNAVCGNGLQEDLAGEQCEQFAAPGNWVPCNAQCQTIVAGEVTMPSASPVTVGLTTASPGEVVYRLNVTAPTRVRADLFAPNQAAGCTANLDAYVFSMRWQLAGLSTDAGVGNCRRLTETRPSALLEPGTYWVVVAPPTGGPPAHQVAFSSFVLGVNPPQFELEPNDLQGLATPTGLVGAGSWTGVGRISPSGDDDVFSFVVPANQTLQVTARTFDQFGVTTSCRANAAASDTRIFLEARGTEATAENTGELAYNDDISATQWCSRVSGTIPPAASDRVFYIRVQGYNDSGWREYFLNIVLQ